MVYTYGSHGAGWGGIAGSADADPALPGAEVGWFVRTDGMTICMIFHLAQKLGDRRHCVPSTGASAFL
jgi:hypothetical protein